MKLGEVGLSERGFREVRFKDRDGYACVLRQSSLAEYVQPGASAVRLGMEQCPPLHLGLPLAPTMHLDRKQVKALVRLLKRWLKDGTFGEQGEP